MAGRGIDKAGPGRKVAARAPVSGPDVTADGRGKREKDLAREEIDRLRMELDTALERIRVLEAERGEAAERVGRAMETLRGLLRGGR